MTAGGGGATAERPNADGASAPAPAEVTPFDWLVGHWTDRETFGVQSLNWSEPYSGSGRKIAGDGASSPLALTITAASEELDGKLETIAPDGKRKLVVTFVITLTGDYSLVWREAGLRYRFKLEGSGISYALVAGDVARVDANRSLRFVDMRGPSRRIPYPIIIELRFLSGHLTLRRVQGPQHGKAVDQIYSFDRAD